ncbi:MAG: Uma2 family endonuclease [Planctomycetaceae bacterium]|nr:Uma2 family endonuclease [Planctomycetaceae bacterium]
MSATILASGQLEVDSDFPSASFSVEEYLQMVQMGAFDDVGRIELLEGRLVRKMTKNPPHAVALGLLDDCLTDRIPDGWYVANQESIQLDDSVPEPDLMIVAGKRRDYLKQHPTPNDVALLVEVADTSLSKDRRKGLVYAKNSVQVYWIVNLVDEQVEVHQQPEGTGYPKVTIYHRGDEVPCVIGESTCANILVDEILP